MTQNSTSQDLDALLTPCTEQVEQDLRAWLVEPDTPHRLADAMRYCTEGGKRLRPTLAMLAAEAIDASLAKGELVRRAALAVELIHAYSLVHDDLPAMDDDDLRRGRPTAHVQYGEAMAILVGDALLTRAFGLLAETGDAIGGRLVSELATAAGAVGMVGGQVADMELCDVPEGQPGLEYVRRRKTGALLRAACRMGAIAAGAADAELSAVSTYGESLGLAFQVYDDLLDATASAEQLGKTPGKDAAQGKKTYVTLLGIDRARELGAELTASAIDAMTPLGDRAQPLADLCQLLSRRTY